MIQPVLTPEQIERIQWLYAIESQFWAISWNHAVVLVLGEGE